MQGSTITQPPGSHTTPTQSPRANPSVTPALPAQTGNAPAVNPANDFHPRNVYVAGLPANFTDESLATFFAQFGTVESARIMRCTAKADVRQVGFVLFSQPHEADAAIAGLSGRIFDGEPLIVRRARISPPPGKQRRQTHAIFQNPDAVSSTRAGPPPYAPPSAIAPSYVMAMALPTAMAPGIHQPYFGAGGLPHPQYGYVNIQPQLLAQPQPQLVLVPAQQPGVFLPAPSLIPTGEFPSGIGMIGGPSSLQRLSSAMPSPQNPPSSGPPPPYIG